MRGLVEFWSCTLLTIILPIVLLSLLIRAFEGEAVTLETFVSLCGELLLEYVASMTCMLERRFLRDGESLLTSDIYEVHYSRCPDNESSRITINSVLDFISSLFKSLLYFWIWWGRSVTPYDRAVRGVHGSFRVARCGCKEFETLQIWFSIMDWACEYFT